MSTLVRFLELGEKYRFSSSRWILSMLPAPYTWKECMISRDSMFINNIFLSLKDIATIPFLLVLSQTIEPYLSNSLYELSPSLRWIVA